MRRYPCSFCTRCVCAHLSHSPQSLAHPTACCSHAYLLFHSSLTSHHIVVSITICSLIFHCKIDVKSCTAEQHLVLISPWLQWHSWKSAHGKFYVDSNEESERRLIWTENYGLITQHNNANRSFSLGLNEFADMVSVHMAV